MFAVPAHVRVSAGSRLKKIKKPPCSKQQTDTADDAGSMVGHLVAKELERSSEKKELKGTKCYHKNDLMKV